MGEREHELMRSLRNVRPIKEHEGLSWGAFLEATAGPPVRVQEQPLLAFTGETTRPELARPQDPRYANEEMR